MSAEPDDGNPDPEEEWRLLEGSTRGDHSGFTELVRRYHRPGLAFCHQILGDYQKAEDAVQKGFANLFQSAARFERRARLKTLLFKIFLNLCINELAKKGENHASFSALGDETDGAPALRDGTSPEPGRSMDDAELAEMVRRALLRLNPRHRAALYLREYADLSYAEIALALSASLAEVKIWIHRGRLAVQDLVRPYLDDGEPIR